ncbi:hypothetical protein JJJ22_00985 [Aeromonas caviae]|uniref:hypothetical protein n=1 Tax=Aeromonas caviae TaxID=648 RepID=UPI00190898A8|nr:hypothetical protein [Aeromonas caviae]MDH0241008.1 hypothetical protein [Aeromonas caviae]QQM74551.1 hypothetical protein JH254_13670 [Aeromonas caviae]QQV19667.1 hypothetical protein JJJ22_00985 [Aeromonas caviae]
MSKKYEFLLDEFQVNLFFASIRSKKEIISLLMKSLKLISAYEKPVHKLVKGKMILSVDKMSRLFFFSETKYFSINFPFFINDSGDKIIFYSNNISDIDSAITSDVLSLISNDASLMSDSIFEFIDPISEIAVYKDEFWSFFRELILFEDGYIRYDHDDNKKRVHATKHPINHYDICYSSNATFKIGLNNKIGHDKFMDLVNINTDCHFIK